MANFGNPVDATEWLSRWAEYVVHEMDCEPTNPPDPRAFKRSPDYWLPDAEGIEGCPEQRQTLIELAFDHPAVAQQIERAIAKALSCHAKYRTKVADVGDAAAQGEGARLLHAMMDLASVLESAGDALRRRDGSVMAEQGRHAQNSIDAENRRLHWQGETFDLRGKQYRIIELLFEASDRSEPTVTLSAIDNRLRARNFNEVQGADLSKEFRKRIKGKWITDGVWAVIGRDKGGRFWLKKT